MKLHEILQKLAAARLITLTGDKYELTHDTLAKLLAGKRSVEEQAVIDWENLLRNKLLGVKQSGALDYLTVAQLEGLKPYLHKLQLNAEEQQFLQESQIFRAQETEAERRRLLMLILFFVGLSLVVLVALFWAVWEGRKAQRELERNEKIVAGMYFYQDRFALCVKKDSSGHFKYGFMDKQGNVRVPYQYDEAVQFDDYGYARVKIKGELYLIDTLNNRYPLAESLAALDNHILALSLKEQHLQELPKEILENPQLKILYLRGNKLKDLPIELQDNKDLIVIDLGFNHLDKKPQVLELLSQLKILDLDNNYLKDFEIGNQSNLEILDLSYNKLEAISDKIQYLQKLKKLDLSNNYIQYLDKAIVSLKELEELNLYQNNLDSIPQELWQRSNLNINVGGNGMRLQKERIKVLNDRKKTAKNTNATTQNNGSSVFAENNISNGDSLQGSSGDDLLFNEANSSKILDCQGIFTTKIIDKKTWTILTKPLVLSKSLEKEWGIRLYSNDKLGSTITISNTGFKEEFKEGEKIAFISAEGQKLYSVFRIDGKVQSKLDKITCLSSIAVSKENVEWFSNNTVQYLEYCDKNDKVKETIQLTETAQNALYMHISCFCNNVLFGKDYKGKDPFEAINCDDYVLKGNKSKIFPLNFEDKYNYLLSFMPYGLGDNRPGLKATMYYIDVLDPDLDELKNMELEFMTSDSVFINAGIGSIELVDFAKKRMFRVEMILNVEGFESIKGVMVDTLKGVQDAALAILAEQSLNTVNVSYKKEIKTFVRYISPEFAQKIRLAASCLLRKRRQMQRRILQPN